MRLYARGRHNTPKYTRYRTHGLSPVAVTGWVLFTVGIFALAAFADITNLFI